jgi:hypothetical protein
MRGREGEGEVWGYSGSRVVVVRVRKGRRFVLRGVGL